ncbi:MAG: hypothetical protein KDJ46_04885 [Rhodobiaceae bacterium]|nr:hypothetical protein [Rhodobiaceae bacterium]
MTDRYTAILEDALSRLEAGDEAARETLYGQARISLLMQFEADSSLDIPQRAAELGRFEAAVRHIEARYAAQAFQDGGQEEAEAELPQAEDEPAPAVAAYPPPTDFAPDEAERLHPGASRADTRALRPRRRFPWIRIFLLILIAAFGAWAVGPLLAEYRGLARYGALAVHGLAVALAGAILFIGNWRMLVAALASPLMLAGVLAGVERSKAAELILTVVFSPLAEQRAVAIDWQKNFLKKAGLDAVGGEQSADKAPGTSPAQTPDTPPATPPAPLSAPPAETGAAQSVDAQQPAATEPAKLAELTLPDSLLGDWNVECDNGPSHRFTFGPPEAPSARDNRVIPHGRLTGESLGGNSRVVFSSPIADKDIEREIAMRAHPWPGKEWLFANEIFLASADFEEGETDAELGYRTLFMCPIKADNITVETSGSDTRLSMEAECNWMVPKPADLDVFYTGTVYGKCRFRRP